MAYSNIQIVAHRGASGYAPENTIAAFELAWELGADAVEGDFRITADGEILCIHDSNAKRVSGESLDVEKSTADELLQLTLLNKHDSKFNNLKIPKLSEVLDIVPEGKGIFIELKSDRRMVPAVVEVLEASDLESEQVHLIAFDLDVLRDLKNLAPQYRTGLLIDFKRSGLKLVPSCETVLRLADDVKCDGVSVKGHPLMAKCFGKQIREAGFGFHVWTVDSGILAKMMVRRGAQSITTNYPDRIRSSLISKNDS